MTEMGHLALVDLAGLIASHLARNDIPVVLVGGSCVAIYSKDNYVTKDLDFIELHYTKRSHLRDVLATIGFMEKDRYFVHPDCDYILEFPSGPLSIGSEPVTELSEIETDQGLLKLLSPTDCIKDRLAAFYFWNDRQSLQQALSVAQHHQFNIESIRNWSAQEGMTENFEAFEHAFNSQGLSFPQRKPD